MPQSTAFCEEYGKNLTLVQARELFFALPAKARKRFTFRCADPRCRSMLRPLVIAALYDREDIPGAKKRSPYFRANPRHEHIKNCTWISGVTSRGAPLLSDDPVLEASSTIAELGLVFKPKPSKSSGRPGKPKEPVEDPLNDDNVDHERVFSDRPETSKFMATVAARYLLYSEERRQETELSIDGRIKGTFHSLCIPLHGFHPHFQRNRIYFGRATVAELTNVYLVSFRSRINPTGAKSDRTTKVEFKFLKRWIESNDRALGELLHELAKSKGSAWCFFYSEAPQLEKAKAKFGLKLMIPRIFP